MKRIVFLAGILSFLFIQYAVSQDTVALQPGPAGKDAQINSIHDENNYGDTTVLKSMAWTHSGVPGQHRGLVEFDLSFLSPEATILEASLNLYFKSYEPSGLEHSGENASYLLKITELWEEDEITWNNQPATAWNDAIVLLQSTSPCQDYTDLDVTGQVQQMVSDPDKRPRLRII